MTAPFPKIIYGCENLSHHIEQIKEKCFVSFIIFHVLSVAYEYGCGYRQPWSLLYRSLPSNCWAFKLLHQIICEHSCYAEVIELYVLVYLFFKAKVSLVSSMVKVMKILPHGWFQLKMISAKNDLRWLKNIYFREKYHFCFNLAVPSTVKRANDSCKKWAFLLHSLLSTIKIAGIPNQPKKDALSLCTHRYIFKVCCIFSS